MIVEKFVPADDNFEMGSLARDLEPHGGRVTMSFWGEDPNPNNAMYLLHVPDDAEQAEACREVCRTFGHLEG